MNKVWLVALLAAGTWPNGAWGHRLEAEAHGRRIQKVKIETWFDLGGTPQGAQVQVFRKADGHLLLQDQLNDKGELTFYADWEPLRVVVSAGDGHQKEIEVLPELGGKSDPDLSTSLPPADRSARVGISDTLVGVAFLLALAAFVLSVRNNRGLAKLQGRKLDGPLTSL